MVEPGEGKEGFHASVPSVQYLEPGGMRTQYSLSGHLLLTEQVLKQLKESDRLCKVVELSMQCCGKLL